MKNRIILQMVLAGLAVLLMAVAAAASEKTVVLTVPDICASNMQTADAAVKGIEGVSGVSIDVDQTTVSVTFDDDKTTVDKFKSALEAVELPVTGVAEE